VRFDVITEPTMKFINLWNVTPCSLVNVYRNFRWDVPSPSSRCELSCIVPWEQDQRFPPRRYLRNKWQRRSPCVTLIALFRVNQLLHISPDVTAVIMWRRRRWAGIETSLRRTNRLHNCSRETRGEVTWAWTSVYYQNGKWWRTRCRGPNSLRYYIFLIKDCVLLSQIFCIGAP
jgi:hypothetical protein